MNWITNHPKSLKGMWPRRVGAEYIEGPPAATATDRREALESLGYVGAYVEMPYEEYRNLPIARNPQEYKDMTK